MQPQGGQMTELQLLRMKMNQKTDETLDSTRVMVKLCDESEKIGTATMDKLSHQGEQLRHVDGDLDVIRSDLKEASYHITAMETCCCCPIMKKKPKPAAVRDNTTAASSAPTATQPFGRSNSIVSRTQAKEQQPVSQPHYITRITNDAREDEMEQNLQQVSGMVSNLKAISGAMHEEIVSQNKYLDRIGDKVETNEIKLASTQQRAQALLGKSAKPKGPDLSLTSMATKTMLP